MPQDLFQPNASTNTAIAVFKVNEPHKDKEVIFYDLKDDGYVLSKSKGRTNAYGKWEKKKTAEHTLEDVRENVCTDLISDDSDKCNCISQIYAGY